LPRGLPSSAERHRQAMSEAAVFAILLDPESLSAMGGPRLWAACRIEADGAEPLLTDDRSRALAFVGGLPVIPRREGFPSLAVPYALEMEAVATLLDAASTPSPAEADRGSDRARPLPEFTPVVPASYGGLRIVTTAHGLEFAFDRVLADALGWRGGDRVGLAWDGARRRLAIIPASTGPELEISPEGAFETSHALPLPIEFAGLPGGRVVEPAYELHEGCVVFDAACLASVEVVGDTVTTFHAQPTVHRSEVALDIPSLAFGALAALALILLAW